ncbi:uncharacterized protein LOC132695551 [Cylas formicarius]|uniref:uncharacterized protein LOC132695551 n=1 Tax=Cylas formicarius TaxID=197179 RepID=UPI0029586357|nr:uncharacterized protein LOC132695551 [Cylas formicarius]
MKSDTPEIEKVTQEYEVFLILSKQGRIMLFAPLNIDKLMYLKILSPFLAVITFVITAESFRARLPILKTFPTSVAVMDIWYSILSWVFVSSCLWNSAFKVKSWKQLFDYLKTVEKLTNKYMEHKKNKSKAPLWLKYLLINLMFVIIHGAHNYLWIAYKKYALISSYLFFRVAQYYMTTVSVFFCHILLFVSVKYDQLNRYLRYHFSRRIIVVRHSLSELKYVMEICEILSKIVKNVNIVFGLQLFILYASAICFLIHSISFAIVTKLNAFYVLGSSVTYVIFFIVSIK